MLGVGEGSVVFGWRGLTTPKHAPPPSAERPAKHMPFTKNCPKTTTNASGHHVLLLCEPQKSKNLLKVCLH